MKGYDPRTGTELWKFKDQACLLYTSDAADERSSVDLGGRRIIKNKQQKKKKKTHNQMDLGLRLDATSDAPTITHTFLSRY